METRGTLIHGIVIFTLILSIGTACSNEDEEVSPPPPSEPGEPEVSSNDEENNEQPGENPLTGLESEGVSPYRPLAVVVSNDPNARPFTGLGDADVVYELLTEGAITRFVAIFHSEQPAQVGPVRSARDYHLDLADGYNAMFIAHGWSPEAKRRLLGGELAHLNGMDYDGTLFERAPERRAPHNSYISFADAIEGLMRDGYSVEEETVPLPTTHEPAEEGALAEELLVTYEGVTNAGYTYDADEEQFLRTSDGVPSVDAVSEEQHATENIFIVEAPHAVIDGEGRRAIELNDGGNAFLFQRGQAIELAWTNEDGRILPVKEDDVVPFLSGSTWIHIVPSIADAVEIESNAD